MSMKIPFLKYKDPKLKESESITVPDHVAIIMDGNGRWAIKRGLSRNAGQVGS